VDEGGRRSGPARVPGLGARLSQAGQPVTLVGFGTFSVSRRKPRKGKNPRTGQPMHVAGGRTPRFKPSKELKRAVR
jgi:DNA-binding protein HU-beta